VSWDTRTGQVWSVHYEANETASMKIINPSKFIQLLGGPQ